VYILFQILSNKLQFYEIKAIYFYLRLCEGSRTYFFAVSIFSGGVMLEKSRYLRTHITTTEDKKQCLAVRSDVQDDWQQICAPSDFECAGTYECNYIECNAKDPLPEKLTKEDMKKGKKKTKKKKKKKKKKSKSKQNTGPSPPPTPPPPENLPPQSPGPPPAG